MYYLEPIALCCIHGGFIENLSSFKNEEELQNRAKKSSLGSVIGMIVGGPVGALIATVQVYYESILESRYSYHRNNGFVATYANTEEPWC